MVRVHHCAVRRGGCTEPFDSGAGKAAAADALYHADTRIDQGNAACLVSSSISGIVVNDQHFPAALAKCGFDPLYQRSKIAALVERGKNDSQFEHLRGASARFCSFGMGHVHDRPD